MLYKAHPNKILKDLTNQEFKNTIKFKKGNVKNKPID